jgi:ABC-2 type transport system ATP-binding protein
MICLEHVRKQFGPHVVLADVSLVTEEGKAYALQGKNGAGKTTLIRIALGLMPADSGVVRVFHADPCVNWAIRKEIGFVSDEDAYFPELTVEEYLWWVGRLRSVDSGTCAAQIAAYTSMFCLDEAKDHFISSLSHGMRRKVLIISAFIGEPKLIVMDEPTNGLDTSALQVLGDLLKSHANRGNTAVISGHDLAFAKMACTDVILLEEGKVVQAGI